MIPTGRSITTCANTAVNASALRFVGAHCT